MFNISDKVFVTSSDTVGGLYGKVIAFNDEARRDTVGVQFDQEVPGGHDCDGEGIDYHCRWLAPRQLSLVSNMSPQNSIRAEGGSVLKKLTNFVKTHLQEPVKSYYRLGWVQIVNDELVTTETGRIAESQASMVEGKDLEKYAAQEIARIEKEEKDSKK